MFFWPVGFVLTDLNLGYCVSVVPPPEDAHVQQEQQHAHPFWQENIIRWLALSGALSRGLSCKRQNIRSRGNCQGKKFLSSI
jgi:hypothetical protein